LFYKYAPHLLTHSHKIAKEMVTTLSRVDKKLLHPAKLIPAFVRYDTARTAAAAIRELDDEEDRRTEARGGGVAGRDASFESKKKGLDHGAHEGIRYFTAVVESGEEKDPTVHNYLISLLVKDPNEDALIRFIVKNGSQPCYDHRAALNMCYHHNKMRACSEIHKVFGEFEEAINVALKINIQLAQLTVSSEISKKLWLQVARHVISTERDDVKTATQKVSDILKHCSLRIEEVLPSFPDFVQIGAFKAEVVKSLNDYNQSIKILKAQMNQHTVTAEKIRKDIEELKAKKGFIPETRRCDLSGESVLSRPFLYFPCGHVFLSEALTDHIIQHARCRPQTLLNGPYAEVTRREAKVRHSLEEMTKEAEQKGSASLALVNITRKEWTKIASNECPLCGSMMIATCHESLIKADEKASEVKGWEV